MNDKYKQVTSKFIRKKFVTSHGAFAYLARDYDLKQVSVMGLSPESEPTAKDMRNISTYVKENDIKYIMFEELVSPKLAETLANDLNMRRLS